jgi:hypothetical protein
MRRAWDLAVAALVVAIASSSVAAGQTPAQAVQPANLENSFGVRLADTIQAGILRKALAGALRRLTDGRCQKVLSEFHDTAGRPLADTLAALGLDAPRYLTWILFRDAPSRYCDGSRLAVTVSGTRVVYVCGRSFERRWREDPDHTEAMLIHEMLHTLGLGENPPSSEEITRRVRLHCDSPR